MKVDNPKAKDSNLNYARMSLSLFRFLFNAGTSNYYYLSFLTVEAPGKSMQNLPYC